VWPPWPRGGPGRGQGAVREPLESRWRAVGEPLESRCRAVAEPLQSRCRAVAELSEMGRQREGR
jgi:hypothetical protein